MISVAWSSPSSRIILGETIQEESYTGIYQDGKERGCGSAQKTNYGCFYTFKILITLGVLSLDFFILCSKLLTGYLCGGSLTTDNPQEREVMKRPLPL